MCDENVAEMKLGDSLEEFIFLVYKFVKLGKRVDYFHISEDVEEEEAKSQRQSIENQDLVVLHSSATKDPNRKIRNSSRENHHGVELKYEMSTVVEVSYEDE